VATILAIDDDRAVLATIDMILKRQGHEIVIAHQAAKGLQLLQDERFDLVIVDIFMPDMDGLETITRVRELRPGLPVIVMSGYQFEASTAPRPDFLHMARELGAYGSLKKPFRPAELLEAVAACLGLSNGDQVA
jgi:CheY-like chemotaxis protein